MNIILTETTTLGLRHYSTGRVTLQRSTRKVSTVYGSVTVKDAFMGGRLIKSSPEYEDARRLARKHRVTLRKVMDSVHYAIEKGKKRN